MTSRESTPSGIPHRFLLLAMLRSLAAGNLLVISGPGAFECFLDGLPHVATLFNYILAHEWIAEANSLNGIQYYRISPRGYDFWQSGEKWWASLSWREQFFVRLAG
ncbi:hypothetical protein ETQ85_04085 [Zoogloea oleivorans]|uniref:Uncharacterized protein n=1 Tax=Zoogloea oleivorans TaxID=1552750 RepID=A0A6C2D4M1_9RHOO|nr:hypothetical protein [Zoogloea oleivorans]TYC61247.1 hypothetical protein ETQ85_04085 [Zoogloea oleivorans]